MVEVCGSCAVALLGFRSSPGVAEGQASVVGRVADADSSPFPHPSSGRPWAPSGTKENVSMFNCSCQQVFPTQEIWVSLFTVLIQGEILTRAYLGYGSLSQR